VRARATVVKGAGFVDRAPTICCPSFCIFDPRSLERNSIGVKGAVHIGEALKINKTLTTLECALASLPHVKNVLILLSAQGQGVDSLWLLLVWPLQSWTQWHWHRGRSAHQQGSPDQQDSYFSQVRAHKPITQIESACLCWQLGGDLWLPLLSGPCSLQMNLIGAGGAKSIGEALKIKTALTDLKCGLESPDMKISYANFVSRGADSLLLLPFPQSSMELHRRQRSRAHWGGS
jgi:hypothetical protein